jgi:hypothetical protein
MSEHRFKYERPDYYPKQFEAIFDRRRYSVIEASTKSGKTSGCIGWLLERALEGKAGQNFWWVAPVSDQAAIAFGRMRRSLPRRVVVVNLTTHSIVLPTQTVVWFKSADRPDSLYGEDVYAAVIDEASRFKEEAWHAVRSTLTYTKGPIRIIGNVRGRRNWFYQLARRAEHGARDMGYHKLVAADAIAAGVLDAEEVEDARRLLPEHVFNELYLAQPSAEGSNPFGVEAIRACVAPMSSKPPAVWGIDLAKHVDWTVCLALDLEGRCCRFERWQAPWEETMNRIARLVGRMPALCDSTGVGDPIVEQLRRRLGAWFEGYHLHQASKQKIMEGLAVAIQSKAVTYPAGVIPDELEVFEYVYARNGGVSYSAPEGFHDDTVVALALAVEHKPHARRPLVISDKVLAWASRPGPATRPWTPRRYGGPRAVPW